MTTGRINQVTTKKKTILGPVSGRPKSNAYFPSWQGLFWVSVIGLLRFLRPNNRTRIGREILQGRKLTGSKSGQVQFNPSAVTMVVCLCGPGRASE
jgi:hypothetical protein